MHELLVVVALVLAPPGPAATAAEAASRLRVVADGPVTGLDADVLTTFARSEGRVMEPHAGTPSEVSRGLADVAAGLYVDALPTTDLVSTSEVFPSRLVAVTRRPTARAATIETLRWSRIGVLRSSRAIAAVRDAKVSGAELTEYASVESAFAALRASAIKSLLIELPDALRAQKADAELELGVFLGARRSYVYAVRSGDPTLLAKLNGYLHALRSTPSWAAIVTRHLGPSAFDELARAHLVD